MDTSAKYIMGMEMMHSVWDIIAMLAPVSGLPPYASGNTTVLRPSADPVAKKERNRTSFPICIFKSVSHSVLIPNRAATIMVGRTKSRSAVAI